MAEGAGAEPNAVECAYNPYRNLIRDNDDDAFRKFFNAETQFMASEGYSANEDYKALRHRALVFIGRNSATRGELFDAFIPYIAMTYFDRFVSRYEIPTVLQSPRENNNLFLICCLTLALKVRKDGFDLSRFLAQRALSYRPRDVLRVETEICVRLGWRLRTLTPLLFVEHFIRLSRLPGDYAGFRESVQSLIVNAQADIAYTQYRPSCVAAGAFLTVVADMFPDRARVVENQLQSSEFLNRELHVFLDCSKKLIRLYLGLDENSAAAAAAAQPATQAPEVGETSISGTRPSGDSGRPSSECTSRKSVEHEIPHRPGKEPVREDAELVNMQGERELTEAIGKVMHFRLEWPTVAEDETKLAKQGVAANLAQKLSDCCNNFMGKVSDCCTVL